MSWYPLSLHTLFSFNLLGLNIFSSVKRLAAIFSASPTYLYLLFILLFWTSQWAAHGTGLLPFWAPSDSSAAVGAAWSSSGVVGFQSFRLVPLTLTEITTERAGDGTSGAARKALARRAGSSLRTEGTCCGKQQPLLGSTKLQEVPYRTRASKSLLLPTHMDNVLV